MAPSMRPGLTAAVSAAQKRTRPCRCASRSITGPVVGCGIGPRRSAALAVFAVHGRVDLPLGLALAAGNAVGGSVGTRLTIAAGHAWLRRLVVVVVAVFAVRLLWP